MVLVHIMILSVDIYLFIYLFCEVHSKRGSHCNVCLCFFISGSLFII